MDLFGLIKPLIGLASQAFERSNHKKKKEYTVRLSELENELGQEKLKPLEHQNDGKIESLMVEITAIARVAEHEARIIANS